MIRINIFLCFAVLICGSISSAETVDLTADQSQSSLTLEILGQSDTSALSGTGQIDLLPISQPFGTAQIIQMDLTYVDGFQYSFFGGLVSATMQPNVGMMTLVTPGPAGTVTNSMFDQLGNEAAVSGTITIVDPLNLAGGSRTVDLADMDNSFFDILGATIEVNGDQLSVSAEFDFEFQLDENITGTATGMMVADGTLPPPEPVVVAPESFTLVQGVVNSGTHVELAESDNVDLGIRRNTLSFNASTEFIATATSPTETPSAFEFTLESAVFSRGPITQTISFWDYVAEDWEVMDSQAASRFTDSTVDVTASGDLSRFVEAGTGTIQVRVQYDSAARRRSFSSNTDQAVWTITP